MEAYGNSTEHIIPRLARFHIKFTDRAAYYAAFDEYHVKHNLGVMEKLFAGYVNERLESYLAMLKE